MSSDFMRRSLQGDFICSVVKRIFEESGFFTSYFGYESLLPVMKKYIGMKETYTALKLRSTPDLIVLNIEKDALALIEVKSKNRPPRAGLIPLNEDEAHRISDTKKLWSECFVIYVVPNNQMFYAQQAKHIEIIEDCSYGYACLNLHKNFKKLEELIYEINEETLDVYRPIVKDLFDIFR